MPQETLKSLQAAMETDKDKANDGNHKPEAKWTLSSAESNLK